MQRNSKGAILVIASKAEYAASNEPFASSGIMQV